jgi:oxygen-dependent protoporphyrinogen oxidase
MRVAILGGGISGLAFAWFFSRRYPSARVTLFEAAPQLGGVSAAPRIFPYSPTSALLQLIQEVGLEKEIIRSNPEANRRFIWNRGALRPVSELISWRDGLRALTRRATTAEDLSIYDFAARRFSPEIAETLFDPLALGIYAGDIRRLSLRSCFPKMYEWDRGRLPFWKMRPKQGGLFSLKGGLPRLIEVLQRQLPIDVRLNSPVTDLNGLDADWIVSALPLPAFRRLTGCFEGVPSASVWTAQLTYEGEQLPKGYGYLIPSQEREPAMGMIWESVLFPATGISRMTAFLRTPDIEIAKEAARRHLQISGEPLSCTLQAFPESIPQFEVGYSARLKQEREFLTQRYPRLILLGNYWEGGASTDACVALARSSMGSL